ncbi:MAG: hypothetical protein ACKVQA_02925 [Burkholderiales bacterium]
MICVTRGHGRIADQPPVVLFADGKMHAFSDVEAGWESSFVQATRHHINALLEGSPPVLSGAQGREILRFCLAAQASAREGRAVKLSELP